MMSANELWILHEEIRAVLSAKLDAEKHELNRRLAQIKPPDESGDRARRPYPKVYPKYRNPERPSETWSGRGKQPRWVAAHLGSGKKVDDLLISRTHWSKTWLNIRAGIEGAAWALAPAVPRSPHHLATYVVRDW
jgi:DNA-binding protein H-NS